MTASRELDALVAEKVMGWERWTCGDYRNKEAVLFQPNAALRTWTKCDVAVPLAEHGGVAVPLYSTTIDNAWTVVERMWKLGWDGDVEWYAAKHASGFTDGVRLYRAAFRRIHNQEECSLDWATTAPAAICLAALKALGIDPEARPRPAGRLRS